MTLEANNGKHQKNTFFLFAKLCEPFHRHGLQSQSNMLLCQSRKHQQAIVESFAIENKIHFQNQPIMLFGPPATEHLQKPNPDSSNNMNPATLIMMMIHQNKF